MPARPQMLDTINEKIKKATVAEIVKPKCCIGACIKPATSLVTLRFADGRTDLYGVCDLDRKKVEGYHPEKFEVKEQGFWLY